MVEVKCVLTRVMGTLCLSALVSCSSNDDLMPEGQAPKDPDLPHTCELILNVTKSGYDDEPQTRSAAAWQNGDKIYLTFEVGDEGMTNGEAIFNDGKWSVNFYGSLNEGRVSVCSAVYFDNPDYESGSIVKLTEQTGIYEDLQGSYTYENEALSVTADLKPKTGRIRFAGEDNSSFTFYGMYYYSAYDTSTGKYSSNLGAVEETVESGYSPYIYGYFPDEAFRCFNLITAESGFNRPFASTFFQPGESGFMTIPTLEAPNGWQNSILLKLNDVEFRMIPVTYEDGNFFLAETETTEYLWTAVMGGNSKSDLPAVSHTYNQWSSFITQLNALTDLEFRFASMKEWQYAAAGGNKSQGFTYSGSNFIDDVAWYYNNSENKRHDIKQLQPNELGFYDMSGNVSEYVQDSFGCGGSFSNNANECTVKSYQSVGSSTSYNNYGLRFALTNPYNTKD